MSKKDLIYRHWVPAAPKRLSFPFAYQLDKIDEPLDNYDITFEVLVGNITTREDLILTITRELIKYIDFDKYMNRESPYYFGAAPTSDFSVTIKIIQYKLIQVKNKKVPEPVSETCLRAYNFTTEYSYGLIKSLNELKEILDRPNLKMAFDTETTGLNPEIDYIVGASICVEPKVGYYIPIAHNEQFAEYNLGLDALRIIHQALLRADLVYMFNSRFDVRMLEYTDDPTEYDYSLDGIKLMDAQLNAHFADPEYREHKLKELEKHFLGYYRDELEDVLKASGIKEVNFSLIDPRVGLFYAAQDAISTFELGEATYKYYQEFGIASQIDQMLLFILMRLENHAMRIDKQFLLEQYQYITTRLKELDDEIKSYIGDVNLNSPIQKAALLKSFGLDTGEKTETGNMATGTKQITAMIEQLKEEGRDYPKWLDLFAERAMLDKLSNTFFGSLLEQLEDNDGRIRINYRLGVTATGRLSSGKEERE